MNDDMAKFIVNRLQNDKYLFARSQNYNNIPYVCKLGSVIFVDDNPICNDMEELFIKGSVSFNLSVQLHRPIEKILLNLIKGGITIIIYGPHYRILLKNIKIISIVNDKYIQDILQADHHLSNLYVDNLNNYNM